MRLILDTNLWSYIGETDQGDDYATLEDRYEIMTVVPPSILLEVMRHPVPAIRDRIVDAMTNRRREHPLPEARQQSDELVQAIQRLRRHWIRGRPKSDRMPPLENFWKKRIWQEARSDPDSLSLRVREDPESSIDDSLYEQQRATKAGYLDSNVELNLSDLWVDVHASTFPGLSIGWEAEKVEWWRAEMSVFYWHNLVTRRRQQAWDLTWVDWVEPWVNLEAMSRDRADYNLFWYRDLTIRDVARSWLAHAVSYMQLATKLGRGNAADAQHSSYLVNADLFVSADKRYIQTLEAVRPFSPVEFARTAVVEADASNVIAALWRALDP